MSATWNLSAAEWIRSSHSDGGGGQCVEFSRTFAPVGAIPVRDSKSPQGPALICAARGWVAFVSAVRSGAL
ncbi:DUF397 domain-containing protein [Streptomyces sp. NPDC127098]|uniref:DUF397 domain-containing protein n=1 Tax=Streptomyces sp. NPDC127098 TaxID=3347137 RepID=UPI00365FF5F1